MKFLWKTLLDLCETQDLGWQNDSDSPTWSVKPTILGGLGWGFEPTPIVFPWFKKKTKAQSNYFIKGHSLQTPINQVTLIL